MERETQKILHSLNAVDGAVWVEDSALLGMTNNQNDMLALRAVAKLMRYMFDWENTSQGHPYWAKVVQNITDLTILKGRKGHPYEGLTKGERCALMSFLEHSGK